MEAIFESAPQATLQLVFIMRTGAFDDKIGDVIIVYLSIIQSIISMTNSILKNDNTRGMQWQININITTSNILKKGI